VKVNFENYMTWSIGSF